MMNCLTPWRVCYVIANILTLWHVFDFMTIFWHHDKLWPHDELYDVMTFFTSWRTFLRHDELFEVMTNLLSSWHVFDMTNCLTLWRFLRHDEHFYVMTCFWLHSKLLTSWRTFWRHDELFEVMTNLLSSWHVFDMTNCLTLWRVLTS